MNLAARRCVAEEDGVSGGFGQVRNLELKVLGREFEGGFTSSHPQAEVAVGRRQACDTATVERSRHGTANGHEAGIVAAEADVASERDEVGDLTRKTFDGKRDCVFRNIVCEGVVCRSSVERSALHDRGVGGGVLGDHSVG